MKAKRIPDITIERYLLNELPSDRMEHIEVLLKEDPSLRKRVTDIGASSRKILKRHMPESVVPKIIARASLQGRSTGIAPAKRLTRKYLLIPSVAAAAIVCFAIIFPLVRSGNDSIYEGDTRIKGNGTELYIYRKKNNSAELLVENRRVREKDLLQIAYYSADNSYGVILSLDGRGTVTLHYPRLPSGATGIEKNRKILLPSSYELDDAPGFERFMFITSGTPIKVREVLRAAEKITKIPDKAKKGQLTIDTSYKQTSLVLLKE